MKFPTSIVLVAMLTGAIGCGKQVSTTAAGTANDPATAQAAQTTQAAPFSSKNLRPAFHLSLSKLPVQFSSRAQDQAGGGMPRLLPRAQRR